MEGYKLVFSVVKVGKVGVLHSPAVFLFFKNENVDSVEVNYVFSMFSFNETKAVILGHFYLYNK